MSFDVHLFTNISIVDIIDNADWIRGSHQIRKCRSSPIGVFYACFGPGSWKFISSCLPEPSNRNHIINKILYFENSYPWMFLLPPVASWKTSHDQVWAPEPIPSNCEQSRTWSRDIVGSIRDSSYADHSWLPRDLVLGDVRCSRGIL